MLQYIGKNAFIPGIPARDLNDDEVEKFGEEFLLKTGLYAKGKARKNIIIQVVDDEQPKDGE